jgi:glutathione S-transferase
MRFTLHSAQPSPFGRKVRLAAAALGLADDIRVVDTNTMDADDPIRKLNPLGKIPALILEDGRVLYDSRVIVEYLDTVAGGGRIIPKETDARFEELRLAALADGVLDAAILIVYEGRFRPDQTPHEGWLTYQRGKIERSLASLEPAPPAIEPLGVGAIGLGCALGYLDFRKQVDWRPVYPGLVSWLNDFAKAAPGYEETLPGA